MVFDGNHHSNTLKNVKMSIKPLKVFLEGGFSYTRSISRESQILIIFKKLKI